MVVRIGLLLAFALGAGALLLPGAIRYWNATRFARSTLDYELLHARDDLGIPASMLQPITSSERAIAGQWAWNADGARAAARYQALYTQLLGVEKASTPALRQQVDADSQTLTLLIGARSGDGLPGVEKYQGRLDAALQQAFAATRPGDYAAADAELRAQADALRAMTPAYARIERLKALLADLDVVGVDTSAGQAEYVQDVSAFQAAGSAQAYARIAADADGQGMQALADEVTAMPAVGPALLKRFQERIALLRQEGEDVGGFQRAHDHDATLLDAAAQPGDYLALATALNAQAGQLRIPLARGQARHDLAVLRRLIAEGQAKRITSPYDGRRYAGAYEYATQVPGYGGYGALAQEVQTATTADDFAAADADIQTLSTLLQAYLANFDDRTPPGHAHASDLRLLDHFGLGQGRVLVISLREQTARFYDGGALVRWSYVTTGRPERPSPPGLHYATEKLSPTVFTSSEPRSSPFWYAPTPVKYAIGYFAGGFFLHDGWWRNRFGPGTNLPHYEPEAFNGGSHGCINFPAAFMPWVYGWTAVGTPVLVY
jgi:hypothetical protein